VLGEIAQSVDDLEHAAMEFSDFARLPALQREDRDLAELLAGWLAPYAASADVRFEPPDGAVRADVDPRLLKRALFNLLANAWQSAAPPPPVTVLLDAASKEARIRVTDAGPGVPPELLERLFEPYFTTKVSGTGLGLLIARRIVEEHGGSIEARRAPEGGLEVEIRLPLAGSSGSGVRSTE
jgi:signal transduction histidine kinase